MPIPKQPGQLTPSTALPSPPDMDVDIVIEKYGKVLRTKLPGIELHYVTKWVADGRPTLTAADTLLTGILVDIQDAIANLSPTSHTHLSESVGLGNVANLAPEDYPLSTAVILALAGKQPIGLTSIGEVPYIRLTTSPEW